MSGVRPWPRHAYPLTLSAAVFALIGCHAPAPRDAVPDRAVTRDTGMPGDSSYDWRGWLVAPFGAVLKSVPIPLHEVLLFRDDAQGGSGSDTAAAPECYAADAPAPKIFGRAPEEYLLCFTHDRLSRIQASVRLPTAQASTEFAAACASWLKNATPAASSADATAPDSPVAGSPDTETAGSESPAAAACEGRDGTVHFKARLEEEPGPAETAEKASVISITLDSPPDHQ
jgi:hypothetical protein